MNSQPFKTGSESQLQERYGSYEIFPAEVVAGDIATFDITIRVGAFGIDDGGSIIVCTRDVSDGGLIQSSDPAGSNYVHISTTGNASLRGSRYPRGYVRPWKRAFMIEVYDGNLSPGDTVILKIGSGDGGSPGYQVQTYCEETFEFKLLVDNFGTGIYRELEGHPVRIVAGKPAKVAVVAPTAVEPGEEFAVTVRVEDRWGNLAKGCDLTVDFAGNSHLEGLPGMLHVTGKGAARITGVRAVKEGVHKISASSGSLAVECNHIDCTPHSDKLRRFWGDLHGQSEETVGINPIEEYMWYAKEASGIDFVGHQGNDFEMSPEVWEKIRKVVAETDEPSRMVALLGFEWSGNTGTGGDRNIYYPGDEGEVLHSSHTLIDEKEGEEDYISAELLFNALRREGGMAVAHVGGRYANLAFHDASVEPCVEICSAWGYFEWFAREALERGYRIGFVGGSDDHTGRPGASYPGREFAVRGGLTCILATELTRKSIWDALFSRRCYATTGQRILLDVRSDGRMIGEAYETADAPEIRVKAAGTAPIERVEIRRGWEKVHEWCGPSGGSGSPIRIKWGGARNRGRGRTAVWDGSARLVNGRIRSAVPYAFQSPAETLEVGGESAVAWHSSTSGNEEGFVMQADESEGTVLEFSTGIYSFSIRTSEIAGPRTFECGGLDLHVTVERLPGPLGETFSGAFTDVKGEPGTTAAYHVKVLQTDGAAAWSSPIYVTFR